jgi:hypothetical protein
MLNGEKVRNAALLNAHAANLRVIITRDSPFDIHNVDEVEDSVVELEAIVRNTNRDINAMTHIVAGHVNEEDAFNLARDDVLEPAR